SFISHPPPSSTLFPYTTLFRSPGALSQHFILQLGRFAVRQRHRVDLDAFFLLVSRQEVLAFFAIFLRLLLPFLLALCGHLPLVGDRKSTRLNSSHVSISYAVFC